ncbi:unnamed protein product [Camellia sinensis]
MSKAAVDVPLKGGFSFDLCRRNEMLSKKGVQAPKFLKTGMESSLERIQEPLKGPLLLIRIVRKIHFMAPNIYCCGAGIAADTEAVTVPSCSYRYHTGQESRVVTALTLLKSHLFSHQVWDGGINLVCEAICSGIFNDLGSGSKLDVCVITKGHTEYLRNHQLPNPSTYVNAKGCSFPKKTEVLLTKITAQRQMVSVTKGGDEMEE